MKHLQMSYRGRRIAHWLHITALLVTMALVWTAPKSKPWYMTALIVVAFVLAITSGRGQYWENSGSDTPIDDSVRRDLKIKWVPVEGQPNTFKIQEVPND